MPKGVYARTAKGKANMKGKCGVFERTAEMNKKNSKALKRYYAEHPEERKQINESIKKTWAKPYVREKQSIVIKKYFAKSGTREKNSKAQKKYYTEHLGAQKKIWQSPDLRKKLSRIWEKRAESSGYPRNYLCPNFNFNSVIVFKALDKVLHVKSRYGGTKAGEKKIGRYFVDCFNKKYEFLLEWNETGHYDNGCLNGYDIKKRDYITVKYPHYTYIIIRQDDWFKNGSLTEKITCDITTHILKILSKEQRGNKYLTKRRNYYG